MDVKATDLEHRSVMDISAAVTVGRVERLVVDPASAQVAGIVLGKADGPETFLPWASIKAVGADAITIESRAALRAPSGPLEERGAAGDLEPIGKRVLTEAGDEIGVLGDLLIDGDSGRVLKLGVGERAIEGSSLLGVGDYAAVISRPA
ncbi:MAG TPA: PRC-barrel domain-containing protein [Aquihabitans sp.]|jgi:sporulation protein YlmC with PRC-barrel domain|nr:PRC-barrel domain-containing protein [Aquihabitans sp.]